jgi:carbonic anhydrase
MGQRGAGHWGDLDPAYAICESGWEQSPIDIRNTKKANLPPYESKTKVARSNI